ncbi:DNA-binding response regulator [Micromonospora tulbaghiae]|uniref:DNA-binding response regulator n=2 Tax=Micromonospora TaxID=1873 RepID=A0A386WHJ2_9ACTN|nr:DNA-binding response regulator [Micromonospora tulbaghiae]
MTLLSAVNWSRRYDSASVRREGCAGRVIPPPARRLCGVVTGSHDADSVASSAPAQSDANCDSTKPGDTALQSTRLVWGPAVGWPLQHPSIHVAVIEELGLLRAALCAVLSSQGDMTVVADVADVADLPTLVRRCPPDVVLLSLAVEAPDPTAVIADVTAVVPGAAVLAMSSRWSPRVLKAAAKAGARGFVGKDGPLDELIRMVRSLAGGQRAIDPTAAVAVLKPATCPLTCRELEVLRVAAEGLPLKEIAQRLFLAHGTVRNYLSAVLRKTGAENRLQAVRKAQQHGWL